MYFETGESEKEEPDDLDVGFRRPDTVEQIINDFEKTELHGLWESRIATGNPDDLVTVIAPSSRTGVSGTGKTTFGVNLAQEWDISDRGFDAETKATLRSTDINKLYEDSASGSAVIWDEAQGTKEDSGMDARRAMKQEVIGAIRDIVLNRDENIALIIITQDTDWLDTRIMKLIDALLLVQRKGRANHYQYYKQDLEFSNPKEYTPFVEAIEWEPLPEDDGDYQRLQEMKQEAKTSGKGDDNEPADPEEIRRQKKIEIAQNMRDNKEETEMTLQDIADSVGMSKTWVSENTEAKKKAKP
jgi:hypothetical protein